MCCLMLSSVIIMLLVFYLDIRRNQISRQSVYGYYMNLSILQNNLFDNCIIDTLKIGTFTVNSQKKV